MMPLDSVTMASREPAAVASPDIRSLADRVRAEGAPSPLAGEADHVTPEGAPPVPLPEPVPDRSAASRLAVQWFMEKMFYGEEEETGVPPLTL